MKTKDIFLVLFINFAFGLAIISAKVGVGEFPPFLFTAMRFLVIAVLLIPFLKIHQGQMLNILIIYYVTIDFELALFLNVPSTKSYSSVTFSADVWI